MPRKSSTLDEAVMLIQILTRIPKGRLITAQQLKQELDAAGIPIRIRTLQRYLKTMASTDVFGIDCDMRSRPYGYKQSTAGGTLLSQQMSVARMPAPEARPEAHALHDPDDALEVPLAPVRHGLAEVQRDSLRRPAQ